MPEPPSPTHGTAFVVAETRAAAHFLRGIAAHVLAIAEVLPLPSQEVQGLLLRSGRRGRAVSEEAPTSGALVDVCRTGLLAFADRLQAVEEDDRAELREVAATLAR
jgi:hypothetical protein